MKINKILKILLLIIIISTQQLNALDQNALEEAESLETGGEPLSAEMEYIGIFEECIEEYLAGKDQSYNIAVCEFLLEKIKGLAKFTGENNDALKMIEKVKKTDLPYPLASKIILTEIKLKQQSGNVNDIKDLASSLNFIASFIVELPESNEISNFSSIAPDYKAPLGLIFKGKPDKEFNAYFIIESSEDADVALHFGSSTPIEIMLNSQKILKTRATRRAIPDQQAIGLKLQKGKNLVSIKCQNKPETCLYLRLTNPDGSSINSPNIIINEFPSVTGEELAKLKSETTNSERLLPPEINTGAEQYLASLYSSDKTNHRVAYFLGYLLLTRESLADNPQAVHHLLLSAARYNPDTAIYLMAIAEANDESKKFAADREENMRRMSLEKAIKIDPGNILARAELARYYLVSQNSPERAEEYITQALKINPIAVIPNIVLYDIYKARGWDSRALQVSTEAAKRDPENPSVQMLLGQAEIQSGTIDNSLSAFEASYKQDSTNPSTSINIFRLLTRKGEVSKAKDFARLHLELAPYDIKLREEYIDLLLSTDDQSTLREITKAREIFPSSNNFTKKLADYYATLGNDKEQSIKYFKQALKYNPGDLKLRRYLEFKGIKKNSPIKSIQDIQSYVAKESTGRIPAGSDKVYILSEKYDKLSQGGIRSRTVHLIIQVFSKNGAEVLKNYPIWYDKETEKTNIELAKVVHTDGSTSLAQNSEVNRQGNKGVVVINFPALDAGDIMEIEYTVSLIKPNFFGSYFGNINLFSNTLPILESRYILSAPDTEKLYFNSTGNAPKPTVTTTEGETTYTWTMKDLPAITLNPNAPPVNELSPSIEVSTFKDWDSLAKWYWNLIKGQNIANSDITAKVKELTINCKTDKEKLEVIYKWVTTEIRNNAWEFGVHGYKPYNASTIFTRRFGDCKDKATLINVMLKIAGIDAWPMLLRSTQSDNVVKGRGLEDFSLPLLSHFNHCISYTELDGKPYYLDGTMMYRTIDSNPSTNAGATAVIIREDGAEMTSTPPYSGDSNRWIDYTGIGLNAEGTADIDFTIATTGESSMYLRAWFNNSQTWDNVLKAVCSERYGHVSAVVVEEFGSNEELDKDEEMLKGRVRIRDYAKKDGRNTITFNIPKPLLSRDGNNGGAFPSEFSVYTTTSRRSTDLILPTLYKIERHLKIEWPAGWELYEKIPKDVKIDAPFGRLSINFEKINNILKLDYILDFKKIRITSNEYPEFRKFCLKADQPSRIIFSLRPAE